MELAKAQEVINRNSKTARIMVINDEPPLKEFFRFNLSLRGYDVLESIGGPEVLALLENEKPELVILDLMVSGVDGFEICSRICAARQSSIIVFNMRGGESDLLRCLEMGVDDYLGRPLGVDELMARVRAVLYSQRLKESPSAENIEKLIELSKI
jgi:DNA-binding response OmpR family regulator